MRDGENRVQCADCKEYVDEAPNVAPGERVPCPACGSTARIVRMSAHGQGTGTGWARLTVKPPAASAVASAGEPTVIARSKSTVPPFQQSATVRVTMPTVARQIQWIPPTADGGSFTMMALDGDGKVLAIVECASWDDGYLELAEDLRPAD